jgi:DNA-binding SARP family transcriptional activator
VSGPQFSILGPLEARLDGRPLRLGSIKHRMVLAKLLLHANQVVSTDELIEAVWGEDPPATVRQSLQNHVAALRRAIEAGPGPARTLLTRDPGYLVRVGPGELDLETFETLTEQGRAALEAGDPEQAAGMLERAVKLWRGPLLADVASVTGVGWPELVGADERRLAAVEARIEADLFRGAHAGLVAELKELLRLHPLREHLHWQLMLALYRDGRQAEALAAFRAARDVLVDELGIEPGQDLQRLEQAILAQDPALELLAPARAPEANRAETRRAERKLITVCFADVDDALGDDELERDPEDVSSMLGERLGLVREQVEGFGGLVASAVGGTVLAVFGVPTTREDDPERAVRAALAIREALPGSQLRIAVATGEALVRPGPDPRRIEPGQLAGDLLVTCGLLQQAAPPGSVLVGEATERATGRAIDYGPASMLSLQGRARPVTVFGALGPRNRSGLDLAWAGTLPLIGRDDELKVALAGFEAARAGSARLLTIVGPPGIGKSRLVAELGRIVEADPELIAWRAGRTQAYGESLTFAALAEIVRTEAGVEDGDPPERVRRRLAIAAREAVGDDPRAAAWVAGHLALLLGVGGGPAVTNPEDEAQAAWRRFLLGMAARRPLVLVVEDLHWADDALLDFIERLADPEAAGHGRPARLLVVATARERLLERRSGWGGAAGAGADLVELAPLNDEDMTGLLRALLAGQGLPAEVDPALLASVAGNPLYAEEYVRMVRDRGLRAGESLPVPETVHAIVAARLDALPTVQKAVLADASVLGRNGWAGALAALGERDEAEAAACLEELVGREFVRWLPRSSVAGQREYEFRHVLVRDVAYAQIPRIDRAGRHRRAAAWFQGLAGGADRSELIAQHYRRALEFTTAAGRDDPELVERTATALREAGDRAAGLGVHAAAARSYLAALELWPEAAPDRPALEFAAGRARCYSEGRGEELLASARDGFLAAGERHRAAEAEMLLGQLAFWQGATEREVHLDRAMQLVADGKPSPSKAAVLEGRMMHLVVSDRYNEAISVARDTIAMARTLGLRQIEATALGAMGVARVTCGDAEGVHQLEHSIQIFDRFAPSSATTWHINLASSWSMLGDLNRSFAARAEARAAADRYGSSRALGWIDLERTVEWYWTGEWDRLLPAVESVIAQGRQGPRHYLESACRIRRGRVHLARGDVAAAHADATEALQLARESGDPQNVEPALVFLARYLVSTGHLDEADELVDELLKGMDGPLKPELGADLGVVLLALGYDASALERGIVPSRWLEAVTAFVAGRPGHAAAVYAAIGSAPDEAYAHLEAARRAAGAGLTAEVTAHIRSARAFFERVGATAYLQEAAELQAAAVH